MAELTTLELLLLLMAIKSTKQGLPQALLDLHLEIELKLKKEVLSRGESNTVEALEELARIEPRLQPLVESLIILLYHTKKT